MSELKVIDLGHIRESIENNKSVYYEYYAKSEADALIAEKDKDIAELKERIAELEKENESLKYSVATLETDLAMSQRWRNAAEELPEDGETVIVLLGRTPKTRGFFLTSRYVAGGWTYGEDPHGCKPTHWLRIPKAPEEVE